MIAQPASTQPYLQGFSDALSQFQGSKKSKANNPTSPFTDILATLTRSYVGPQWRTISYLWDKYETGLKHSREGQLSSAEQVFAEAARLRSPLQENRLLSRLIDVAALPAIAYLRYKQALYEEAANLLIASIDSDAELVSEGFYVLDYHRIQQLHNLARLYFRQNRLDEGATMISAALRFMTHGDTPLIGTGGGWSTNNSDNVPVQLRSDMLSQLTNETIGLMLTLPGRQHELGRTAFADLLSWEARTDEETMLLEWFTLRQQSATGQFDEFVRNSIPFLMNYPVHADYCKLSIVIDIAAGISQDGDHLSAVSQVVIDFIGKLHVGSRQRETCSLLLNQLVGKNA